MSCGTYLWTSLGVWGFSFNKMGHLQKLYYTKNCEDQVFLEEENTRLKNKVLISYIKITVNNSKTM